VILLGKTRVLPTESLVPFRAPDRRLTGRYALVRFGCFACSPTYRRTYEHQTPTDLLRYVKGHGIDDAELAAITFLAWFGNRTLDAYRHDLKSFFGWATIPTSPFSKQPGHTSSCIGIMEQRGLAASTIEQLIVDFNGVWFLPFRAYRRTNHLESGAVCSTTPTFIRLKDASFIEPNSASSCSALSV
jgi:hypothetical protein